MRKRANTPTAALVVAILALVAAVSGAAIASPAAKKAVTKKKVKKIADKEIDKLAPELSVAHAGSADTATNASNADNADHSDAATSATTAARSAGPIAFAEVEENGNVIESRSRGIADANVVADPMASAGHYCFKGLGFTPRSVQATVDDGGPRDAAIATLDASPCASLGVTGTQVVVEGFNSFTNTDQDLAFFIWLASG
jgi:hypothetical protein